MFLIYTNFEYFIVIITKKEPLGSFFMKRRISMDKYSLLLIHNKNVKTLVFMVI